MTTAAPTVSPSSPREIAGLPHMSGPIEPVRKSPLYVLGLLVVAILMLALPLAYLAIIALVGYLVYFHATANTWLFDGTGNLSRATIKFALLAYFTPLVGGVLVILFMLKPLFARRKPPPTGLSVTPEQEPLLFKHVHQLCEAVGAPTPREIKLDCDVNASASFRRGWLSFFGNDLCLTIGLPLAAGMTVNQLTGVLAHEFGHFAQGSGMRLSYIIKSINMWFARVVYERDTWDYALQNGLESDSGYAKIFALLLILCIWLTRRVLWLLMLLGHAVSCFVSRQMEYDADRYEARVTGSAAFAETFKTLRDLSIATGRVYGELRETWRGRRLTDNLPLTIAATAQRIPADVRAKIDQQAAEAKTALFATHPADRDRNASAAREEAPGIIHDERPAASLFRNFDGVCKTLTFVHFRDVIGDAVQREHLVASGEMIAHQNRTDDESDAWRAYFGHTLPISRPFIPDTDDPQPAADVAATVARLRTAHQRISAALPKVIAAYKRDDEADDDRILAERADALMRARVSINPREFKLTAATEQAVQAARVAHTEQRTRAAAVLDAYEKVQRVRIASALQLLANPKVAARIENTDGLLEDGRRMLRLFKAIAPVFNEFEDFRYDGIAALSVLSAARRQLDNPVTSSVIRGRLSRQHQLLRAWSETLSTTEYPFPQARPALTVGRYLIESVPIESNYGGIIDASITCAKNLNTLYHRALARLAFAAAQVEKHVGLPPPAKAKEAPNTPAFQPS